MLLALQHCALLVADLDASRRFYGEILGLEEVPRPSNFTFGGAWFRAGPDEIHLIVAGDTTGAPGLPDPGRAAAVGLTTHLAFEIDSLESTCARLAGLGVELAGGPMERGDGVEQIYVLDPDGYVVELFEVTGSDQSAAPERAPIRE